MMNFLSFLGDGEVYFFVMVGCYVFGREYVFTYMTGTLLMN